MVQEARLSWADIEGDCDMDELIARAVLSHLSLERGEAGAYHKLAPPPPYVAKCVCGVTRKCAENWWLVERRDVQPPEWLVFTGCNPPTWTTDAWKAQRSTLR